MESYHTGYKFGGGPRNEARVLKFLPPSLGPRVFPELWQARLAPSRGGAVQQLAAVLRIKASWRLRCCALAVCGYGEGAGEAKPKFLPRPCPPGFSRVAGSSVGELISSGNWRRELAAVLRIKASWRLHCCALLFADTGRARVRPCCAAVQSRVLAVYRGYPCARSGPDKPKSSLSIRLVIWAECCSPFQNQVLQCERMLSHIVRRHTTHPPSVREHNFSWLTWNHRPIAARTHYHWQRAH